jgi:hypothetical protein
VSWAPFSSVSLSAPPFGERIVSPKDVAVAMTASISASHQLGQWVDNYKVKNEKKEDPVITEVRSRDDLNSHEEKLLRCVVDASELSAIRVSFPIFV